MTECPYKNNECKIRVCTITLPYTWCNIYNQNQREEAQRSKESQLSLDVNELFVGTTWEIIR